jgi:hypothetical protein
MPNGIPVATVALNGAKNAGILAASIIGAFDTAIGEKMDLYKKDLESAVLKESSSIEKCRSGPIILTIQHHKLPNLKIDYSTLRIEDFLPENI